MSYSVDFSGIWTNRQEHKTSKHLNAATKATQSLEVISYKNNNKISFTFCWCCWCNVWETLNSVFNCSDLLHYTKHKTNTLKKKHAYKWRRKLHKQTLEDPQSFRWDTNFTFKYFWKTFMLYKWLLKNNSVNKDFFLVILLKEIIIKSNERLINSQT